MLLKILLFYRMLVIIFMTFLQFLIIGRKIYLQKKLLFLYFIIFFEFLSFFVGTFEEISIVPKFSNCLIGIISCEAFPVKQKIIIPKSSRYTAHVYYIILIKRLHFTIFWKILNAKIVSNCSVLFRNKISDLLVW